MVTNAHRGPSQTNNFVNIESGGFDDFEILNADIINFLVHQYEVFIIHIYICTHTYILIYLYSLYTCSSIEQCFVLVFFNSEA